MSQGHHESYLRGSKEELCDLFYTSPRRINPVDPPLPLTTLRYLDEGYAGLGFFGSKPRADSCEERETDHLPLGRGLGPPAGFLFVPSPPGVGGYFPRPLRREQSQGPATRQRRPFAGPLPGLGSGQPTLFLLFQQLQILTERLQAPACLGTWCASMAGAWAARAACAPSRALVIFLPLPFLKAPPGAEAPLGPIGPRHLESEAA